MRPVRLSVVTAAAAVTALTAITGCAEKGDAKGGDGSITVTAKDDACEVSKKVGDSFRQEWEMNDGTQRFGFEGELLESEPPYREVTTERMIGMEGPGATNQLTLTPVEGGTLLSLVITYPSKEIRDMALGTGMVDGMESSYARLEREVLPAA